MNKKTYVMGVAGTSGAGKTFFLNCFLKHFHAEEVALISLDDYYLPAPPMTKEDNKLFNFDLPSAFDSAAFIQDIQRLLDGKMVYKKEYTFNNPKLTPHMLEIKPAPLLILEGLFIFHFTAVNQLIDQRVFIEADEEVALKRRIKRDLAERGYNEQDVRYKWDNHVMPAFYQYLFPYKASCDVIIENNTNVKEDMIMATQQLSVLLRSQAALATGTK